jgi:hypothetical protein
MAASTTGSDSASFRHGNTTVTRPSDMVFDSSRATKQSADLHEAIDEIKRHRTHGAVLSGDLQDLTKGSDIASFRLPLGCLRHRGRRLIAGNAADGYADNCGEAR